MWQSAGNKAAASCWEYAVGAENLKGGSRAFGFAGLYRLMAVQVDEAGFGR
jgi:hypothetical protein